MKLVKGQRPGWTESSAIYLRKEVTENFLDLFRGVHVFMPHQNCVTQVVSKSEGHAGDERPAKSPEDCALARYCHSQLSLFLRTVRFKVTTSGRLQMCSKVATEIIRW